MGSDTHSATHRRDAQRRDRRHRHHDDPARCDAGSVAEGVDPPRCEARSGDDLPRGTDGGPGHPVVPRPSRVGAQTTGADGEAGAAPLPAAGVRPRRPAAMGLRRHSSALPCRRLARPFGRRVRTRAVAGTSLARRPGAPPHRCDRPRRRPVALRAAARTGCRPSGRALDRRGDPPSGCLAGGEDLQASALYRRCR